MECGIADVNGDGVVDRVSGTSVFLGTGSVDGTGFFTAAGTMSLPGPLANETNNIPTASPNGGGTSFSSEHQARLIDLTGDGIPDYVTSTGSGTGWSIFVGTGTGFSISVPVMSGFVLGINSDSCSAAATVTISGLADVDGDGRAELVKSANDVDAPGAQEEAVYHYDSAGHGDSVVYKTGDHLQNSQTLYTTSQIDSFGRVRHAQYGVESYTADYADVGRRLLHQVTVASMAGSRQIAFQGFDPLGRERSRTETKNNADTSTTTYAYDALDRLSSSVKTGTATPFNQQFAYDPLGNLLSQTDTSGAPGATNTALTYLDGAHDRDRICRISYPGSSGEPAARRPADRPRRK